MSYADLLSKNGSPDDGAPSIHTRTRTRDRNNILSPQRRRASRHFTSAADSFMGRECDDADADESGSDSDEESGYINSDIGSTRNDGEDVSMARTARNLAKRVKRRVKKESRQRGGNEVRKEIVVSPYKPSSSRSKVNAQVEERDNATDEDYRAGPSNAAAQSSSTRKHGSVRRTYAGLRKINGTPVASRADRDVSYAPGHNGFRPSSLVRGDNFFSDEDSVDDSSPLDRPSRKTDNKIGGRRGASRSTPIGSRSILELKSTPNSSPLQPNYDKNLFYASLSNAVNGQRREVLVEKRKLTSKSESNIKQSSDNGIAAPQPSKPAQWRQQSQDRTTRYRVSFYGVVISPRPLPVPREMYKSVDEYIAQEDGESELPADEDIRGQRRKGREVVDREISNRLKQGPIRKLSKQGKAEQEVIYVSSGSDVPAAGSSKARSHKHSDRSGDEGVLETRGIAWTNINPSLEDGHSSSDGLPRKKPPGKATSTQTQPVKRIRKRRRTGVITSSSSGSASEARNTSNSTLLGENAYTPARRYGRPRRSTTALPPPETGRSNASEQRSEPVGGEEGINQDQVVIPNSDDVAEELAIEGSLLRDVSATPGAYSFPLPSASASSQKKDSAPPSGEVLPEIVVSTKPPSTPSIPADKRSIQPGSPTLCSSSAHNRLPTLSPSSRSTTLAVFQEDLSPNAASDVSENEMSVEKMKAKAKLKTDAGANVNHTQDSEDDDHRDSDGEGDQAEQRQNILPSSSDEEDDVCHRCRSRNVYAKMKCTNPKRLGLTCSLHYCHRCIVVFFPNIEFDPYSPNFVCPSCVGTCDCVSCLKKRGIELTAQRRDVKRWDQLGVTLLLSQQETRRRERQEMRRAAGLPDLPKEASKSIKRRSRSGMSVKISVDIGDEAKQWIKQQMAGKKHIRAFVGAWQDAWGPVPFCVHEMAGVDFDIHAADGAVRGKGKAKAIDSSVRLFVGNSKGLYRPFVRAEDVLVSIPALPSSEPAKKRPGRKRKLAQDTADAIYVTPGCTATESWAAIPDKKRRLVRIGTNALSIPEFTMDHQGSSASPVSATSTSYHPTPDDFAPSTFLGLDLPPRRNQMRYLYPNPGSGSGVGNDPVLGSINVNGPLSSDGLVGPDMDADWDINIGSGTKQHLGVGDFTSYDGMYDSYAAALGGVGSGMGTGMNEFDGAFDYEAVRASISPIRHIDERTEKGVDTQTANAINPKNASSQPGDSDKFMQVLDPAILEAEAGNASRSSERNAADRTSSYNLHQDSNDPDPMRFLTAHGRENALLPVPMIYGVPSSTGLSVQDLERTLKESLSLISN